MCLLDTSFSDISSWIKNWQSKTVQIRRHSEEREFGWVSLLITYRNHTLSVVGKCFLSLLNEMWKTFSMLQTFRDWKFSILHHGDISQWRIKLILIHGRCWSTKSPYLLKYPTIYGRHPQELHSFSSRDVCTLWTDIFPQLIVVILLSRCFGSIIT